jgi:hypothetical protein
MQLPLTYWVPSIAPSGMTFLRNGQPNNEADILIGALAGTHIHWLKMKDNKKISATRSLNGYARFRDIRQAPSGKIYAMTESPNRFVLLRSSVSVFTSIEDEISGLIEKTKIYPNPSNGESTLSFYVSNNQFVSIKIFNTNGLLIQEISSKTYSIGKHLIKIESDKLPQGLYFIEMAKGDSKSVLKFIKM